MSETIVGIFVGLLATLITNITSICIANRNRKVQHDMAIKEMELKEKIEYHKLGIDYLVNKITQLEKWNIDLMVLAKVQIELQMIKNSDNEEKRNNIIKSNASMICQLISKMPYFSVYLTKDNKNKVIELISDRNGKYPKLPDNVEKAKKELELCLTIHSIVLSEMSDCNVKIDKLVEKYIV